MSETKLYQISSVFARENKIPVFFIANELISTQKAVYLYGRGTLQSQKMGVCCICGRGLTHPVSVILGIGPECGGHYWDWGAVGGYSEENLDKLKLIVHDMPVDTWMPKALIKEILPSEEQIETPAEHPMFKRKPKSQISTTRKVDFYQNKYGDKVLKVEFPFNLDDLQNIKTITGRRFVTKDNLKFWTIPISYENVEKLKEWRFEVSQEVLSFYENEGKPVEIEALNSIKIPGLKYDLFPFQNKGVAFLEEKNGRGLIADEMGLGKTVQALAYLQLHPEMRPAVIVCPASLKLNWKKEAEKWVTNADVEIISGKNVDYHPVGNILIINYDILSDWVDNLIQLNLKIAITDECHYYKSNTAQRTKAVKKLGKYVSKFIALSGTPIVNRPIEIFNAINIINPLSVPSFWDYTQRYCGRKNTGYGWDVSGATNTEELHELLVKTVMIRRKKADVLTELPDKIYSFVPIELKNRSEYEYAERNFIQYVKNTKGKEAAEKASAAETLTAIGTLKQLAVKNKLDTCIKWIENFIEVDEKIVIFAVHKFVIDALMEAFKGKAVKIDGSVPNEKRQLAVDEFQTNPDIKVFVGNIKAAGVGLTLTAASNVAFLELPWTPGELSQAEDRCHRIGQKNAVTIHYLLAQNTIEESIANLIDRKRKVLDQVLDGRITEQESLLSELMNQYLEK